MQCKVHGFESQIYQSYYIAQTLSSLISTYSALPPQSGTLQLFDIASSAMIEEIEAHEGALWSLCVLPDKRGIVTGSADQKVKFWQFELIDIDEEEEGDGETGDKKSEPKAGG